MRSHRKYRLALLLGTLILSACASTQKPLSDPDNDPWESFNRGMYKFNTAVDRAVLRPIAKGYDKVTPQPVQKGIGNFLHNLSYPATIINLALQGKFKKSAIGTGRFVLNSTVGLLGFFDVATKADIPDYDEDFGQTLAAWGWDDSRYLMLPFFGPSTLRDGIGRFGNNYIDPISQLARQEDEYRPLIFDVVHTRAGLLSQEQALEEAFDPYIFLRDAWLQSREYDIYDGDPPLPDYEDFLD